MIRCNVNQLSFGVEMPFSESLKKKIRKQSQGRCCICQNFPVEIHHIIPQAERGSDNEENAAPLCPTCHTIHGDNPKMRKQIRERRDDWLEHCRISTVNAKLNAISDNLPNLVAKDYIGNLASRTTITAPKSSENNINQFLEICQYSFVRKKLIHPLIVRELLGCISDRRETIVSVDLKSANRSNRFYGDFSVNRRNDRLWVKWEDGDREFFEYSHIATSPTGVEIVECYDCSGGSGVFGSIGLFCLEYDRALEVDRKQNLSTCERVVLKNLGSVCLGDRYKGKITYKDERLIVGPDIDCFNRGQHTSRKFPIQ